MKIRKLDNEGDWVYGQSESDYLTQTTQAVGLNILTRLREWYTDCFFNYEAGIDYPTRLSNYNQKDLLDYDVQRIISDTEEVISIDKFESELDVNTRHYMFDVNVICIYSSEAIRLNFNTKDFING